MHIAKVTIAGITPYSQSRNIDREVYPERPKEGADEYDARNWRYHLHVNSDGLVEIPSTAISGCIKTAAQRLRMRIKGKGQAEYGKYFVSGIDVAGPITLDVRPEDVVCERLFLNSDGKKGSGSRVYRRFPRIDKWGGEVVFYVLDDIITEDVFRKVLGQAGLTVGLGRFRPENGGYNGRFKVTSFAWIEDGDAVLVA